MPLREPVQAGAAVGVAAAVALVLTAPARVILSSTSCAFKKKRVIEYMCTQQWGY